MIKNDDGRFRSYRTRAEIESLLIKEMKTLTRAEREVFEIILQEITDGASDSPEGGLLEIMGGQEFRWQPVSMDTFLTDPYYLGNVDGIFPRIKEDLVSLFEGGYHEAVLTGSLGWGKTFFASIGICRLLYEISCLKDPHKSFGLSKGSNISVVNLSINEDLATKVVFENIAGKLKSSKYFAENFPYEATKKELRFQSNVWVAARSSSDSAVLGLNVIGGILDECLCDEAQVLLADGSEKPAGELFEQQEDGSPFEVASFDFPGDHVVAAPAMIKRSTPRQCFELVLEDGSRLPASWDHPVAVRRHGRFVFNVIRDIEDGDEVLSYVRTVVGGEEEVPRREDAGEVGRWDVCGPKVRLDLRGTSSALSVHEGSDCSGGGVGSSGQLGRGQSVFWSPAHGRRQGGDRCSELRSPVDAGAEAGRLKTANRQGDALGRVQGGVVRKEQDPGVFSFGGNEAEDLASQRLELATGELEVPRQGANFEGRPSRVPVAVGAAGDRDAGGRSGRGDVRVREVLGAVRVAGADSPNGTGLSCNPEIGSGSGGRGQAAGVHVRREGAGQDDRRSEALRGVRLGLHGLGRTLVVGRVVSKVDLGVRPTYDICVPGREIFVAGGTVVHNTNFMAKSASSKAAGARFGHYDHADSMYVSLRRRMKSRFEKHGRLPGMLFVVSSKKTSDDFTAKRVRTAGQDPTVFVRDYALWDVKPQSFYSTERFTVFAGDESSPSKILTPEEAVVYRSKVLPEGSSLVEVPVDFRQDFDSDLEGALRDIAGVATVAVHPFIGRREKIAECVNKTRLHPFSVEIYDPSKPGSFLWERMVREVTERSYGDVQRRMRPILSPNAIRHIHIDPSLRHDATGFCMAHISGWKNVERRADDGTKFYEKAPVYVVDLILRIVPPVGGEIILADIRRLVYDLSAHGYSIGMVSLDSWQSADSLQQLKAKGYKTEMVSVDTSLSPYENVKSALYENRLDMYAYPQLLSELRQVEKHEVKRKIDHPPQGCFVGRTRVPLLDGSRPEIADLVGRDVWVYASGPSGQIVPGAARGRFTKEVQDLVDVVLDNGAVERCTPEHPWRLWDGSYKEARALRPGIDRLMPVRQQWPVNGGYERVADKNGVLTLTHHMVWEHFNGALPPGALVHHRNEIKTDNSPANLEACLARDHAKMHTAARHQTDPEWRERLYNGLRAFNKLPETRAKRSLFQKRRSAGMSAEAHRAVTMRRDSFRSDIDLCALEGVLGEAEATNANSVARILGCGRNVVMRVLHDHGFVAWDEFREKAGLGLNHKVRAVFPVRLSSPEPVFDLEVLDHSNFALSSGVFVHNSKDCSDALAGCLYTLSNGRLQQPIPMMRGISGNEDSWMAEQFQATLTRNQGPTFANEVVTVGDALLPPFLTSGDGGGEWGGGWNPNSL